MYINYFLFLQVFPPFFNTATEAPATTTESIVEIFNNAFEDPTSSDGEIITTTSDTPKDPESVHISILNDIVVESDSSSQLKNFRIPGLDVSFIIITYYV